MITNVLLCAPIADLVKMNIVDLCILIKSFERKKIQDGRHFDHALGFLGGGPTPLRPTAKRFLANSRGPRWAYIFFIVSLAWACDETNFKLYF